LDCRDLDSVFRSYGGIEMLTSEFFVALIIGPAISYATGFLIAGAIAKFQ